KNKGIIASNAYSMQPLVEFLGEIAKAFPNEYPRRVTIEDRKAISQKLPTPSSRGEDDDE
ncbi:hypothetical protein, partial [Acidisoma silvae]|uniref:hypothetical protein n=1 Tax=Acidisoma silvae TaxID=2802396 RepID=UPI001D09EB36